MVTDIWCTFDHKIQLSTKCQKALWCIGVTAQLYLLCCVEFKANHSTKQISLLMNTEFYMIFVISKKAINFINYMLCFTIQMNTIGAKPSAL